MAGTFRSRSVVPGTHRSMVGTARSGVSTSRPEVPIVQWSIFSPQGPALSHHVGVVIRNRFYIHGGVERKGSIKPLDKLHCMDFTSGLWTEVRAVRSPALSHHAGLAMDDRYMVLVGGWNGHKRCTDVYVFDVQEQCWLPMDTLGFPAGGGLSSHSMVQLDTGDMLVVGREGSARIQRRMSHVYALRGSILRSRFVYEEQTLEPASRSGHTMHFTSGNLLCIYGGRADQPIEGHRGYLPGGTRKASTALARLRELCEQKVKPLTGHKIPGGRRHHVSLAGAGSIFIHGGETFDGKCREAVGEMLFVVTRSELVWYRLGSSESRAGHVCVQHGDDIYMHGGEGPRAVVYGATYKLNI